MSGASFTGAEPLSVRHKHNIMITAVGDGDILPRDSLRPLSASPCCLLDVSDIKDIKCVLPLAERTNSKYGHAPGVLAEAMDDVPMILKRETFERKSPTGL